MFSVIGIDGIGVVGLYIGGINIGIDVRGDLVLCG